MKILIADDHFVVRIGLAALVGTEPDMEVIAEAADGGQAIELYEKHRPDLALIDSRMPVRSGIEATIEIKKKYPDARIVMLTAFDGDVEIQKALEAGAQGYVLKSARGEDLIPAIRAVAAGQRWIPALVARQLSSRKSFEQLSARELQVLGQLAKGLANKEIAEALKITEYTVKDHLKSILGKLRAADRTEALALALQRGIIQL